MRQVVEDTESEVEEEKARDTIPAPEPEPDVKFLYERKTTVDIGEEAGAPMPRTKLEPLDLVDEGDMLDSAATRLASSSRDHTNDQTRQPDTGGQLASPDLTVEAAVHHRLVIQPTGFGEQYSPSFACLSTR
jgi:hypothetical protein